MSTAERMPTDERVELLIDVVEELISAIESLAGPPPLIAQEPAQRGAQIAAKDARRLLRQLDSS